MAKFVDQFSRQADIFKQYRPTYPDELYCFISSLCNERKSAWDCGCGNGQSTLKLADFFECVVGTDASQAQIANAPEADKINFRVALLDGGQVGIQAALAASGIPVDADHRDLYRLFQ